MTNSRGVKDIGVKGFRDSGIQALSEVEGGRWKAGGSGSECLVAGGELYSTRNERPVTRHGRVVLAVGWILFGSWVGGVAAQETGWKTDLEKLGFEVPMEALEKGEIVGQKWMVQGAGPGFLGARAFFLATGEPEKVAREVLEFDPTKGRTLAWSEEGSVKIYEAFPRPPAPEAWNRFREALGQPPFDLLLQVEGRKEGRVHLHPAEIQKVSSGKINGWIEVLTERIQTYHRGGWKENAGVPSGPDSLVDFDESLRDVLKENGPVRDEYRRVLTALAYGGQDKTDPVEVRDYWQLMEVDKSPAVALGCAVMRKGTGGRYEVADMHYYASNGYYGAVSLYGIWPYQDGKSLVCRIDAVETDPFQLTQATARMIGESLFMREVKSGCDTIRKRLQGN